MKKKNLWISVGFGVVLFGVLELLSPYSMYIGWPWFLNQMALNGGVCVMLATVLFKMLEERSTAEDFGTYLWYAVMLGLGNAVFTVMYYSARVNLALLALALVKLLWDRFRAWNKGREA